MVVCTVIRATRGGLRPRSGLSKETSAPFAAAHCAGGWPAATCQPGFLTHRLGARENKVDQSGAGTGSKNGSGVERRRKQRAGFLLLFAFGRSLTAHHHVHTPSRHVCCRQTPRCHNARRTHAELERSCWPFVWADVALYGRLLFGSPRRGRHIHLSCDTIAHRTDEAEACCARGHAAKQGNEW